ncbi:MAG: ChaB family protein [Oculatellaceae cyanobacterium bins.114]|nr:ChaB family protein [Oculatellaceae cyanobacterium bins.114]
MIPSNVAALERTVTTILHNREQVDSVIRRLLDQGISRDHISVIGKNFHSETRISGFLTRKDLILGGLRQGGIFGSLAGSVLGLLTGVGVLFIPFVGTVVAAGPIGAVLLGAATGAIAGAAGAGLVSAFVALGLPEDKATLYQTHVEAGHFLIMVETSSSRVQEVQTLLQGAGGEEISIINTPLPRQQSGQIREPNDLSPEVRSHLSTAAQQVYIDRYNAALTEQNDERQAEHVAWDAVHQQFDEDEHGVWSKQKAGV